MGVQLNRSLFNLLRTDLIVDFEGYFVDKKYLLLRKLLYLIIFKIHMNSSKYKFFHQNKKLS